MCVQAPLVRRITAGLSANRATATASRLVSSRARPLGRQVMVTGLRPKALGKATGLSTKSPGELQARCWIAPVCAYLAVHVLCFDFVQDRGVGKHVAQTAGGNCQVMIRPLASPAACASLLIAFVQDWNAYDKQALLSVAWAARGDLVNKLVARLALDHV